MAALCPGVQYGLSSQQNFGENKDLIFVKLTDSALRAIYDYIKNQNKFSCQGQGPTIKFLGNEGQLSFPSVHNGSTSFSFSMSSTADMEGPGGSFECVQQTGPPRGPLGVLGSIPYKVRVHANDDVYEATRHRMTIAEENHKNKCTREIKPNQTDIGRKVKLKQSRTPLPPVRREPLLPSTQRENLSKPSYQSTNTPSNININSNINNNNNSSNNNSNNNNNNSSKPLPVISSSNGLSNGLGSNHVSSSRPQLNKPSVPDIAKRPIKERLIHLLALRPYKKVELHDRLIKEGVREKNGMTSILKQIAFMKDNCYHLNRAMWNEVNEDWPFYTESEKQMLKRRKPQNLTPPGSSDGGSSGSGQSPTSTHPGSPPLITSTKRPGYYDNQDGLPTKRQRISHFRKPSESTYRSSPIENNSQRRPITDSRDASNMNPRSRESPTTNGYHQHHHHHPSSINNYTNGIQNEKRNFNDDIDDNISTVSNNNNNNNNNRKRICDSHNYGLNRDKTFVSDGGGGNNNNNNSSSNNNHHNNNNSRGSGVQINNHQVNKKIEDRPIEINNTLSTSSPSIDRNSSPNNGGLMVPNGKYNHNNNNNNNNKHDNKEKDRNKYDKVTSSSQNRLARVSPDSQSEGITTTDSPLSPIKNNKLDSTSEFPDYLTEYTTIKDAEQRRRYKADFNADYAEYKDLHGIVEKVSRRFAELELRLKQEDASSPRYKDIKKQIVREYQENKKDLDHQKSKRRFQYLHEKLSHIKRLVLEYDQGLIDNQY